MSFVIIKKIHLFACNLIYFNSVSLFNHICVFEHISAFTWSNGVAALGGGAAPSEAPSPPIIFRVENEKKENKII